MSEDSMAYYAVTHCNDQGVYRPRALFTERQEAEDYVARLRESHPLKCFAVYTVSINRRIEFEMREKEATR